MWVLLASGDRCEEHGIKRVQNFQYGNTIVPAASGDRHEEHEHKKIEPIPNFVTWRSRTLSTRRRSFKTCRISWQEHRTYQNLQWKLTTPIYWCGDGLWYRRWKLHYMWIRKFGRIQGFGFDDIESMFNATKRLMMFDLEIRKCEMSRLYEPFMDEFHVARDDRQKMDEDKSMRPLGFGILLGKDSYFKGFNCTMERLGGNFSSWEFFQWVIGMDGEPIEFEWKNFQDSQDWKFFTEFNTIWRIYALNRNNFVIESSSCPCSMT